METESRPGLGLTIRLRIPITNTLLTKEAILIKLADMTFCLPLEYVVEIVTLPLEKVHSHKRISVFEHRGRMYNILPLKSKLGLPPNSGPSDGGIGTFIILKGKFETLKAIATDEILGQQKIVIKDFEMDAFRRLPYCQGLTLLGDGRVVLVLDAENMISESMTVENRLG